MKDLKQLLKYLGRYRWDMVIGMLLIVVETAFEMFIPILMADLIDVGVANHDVAYILHKGVQMGICALLALITGLLYARFAARASYGWGANIRQAQYERVQNFAFSNLDHFETSSLITRMTTDVTVLQNAINGGYRPMVRGPMMLIMGVALSFWMNPRLAVVFLVCAPVLGVILFFILRKVAPMYTVLQGAVDRLNNVVQEGLTAIRAVKAFVRGDHEIEKFQQVNTLLTETSETTFHYAVLNLPAFQLTMYTAAVLIMWFGGNMVLSSQLQVGDLTGFLSYVFQVMNSMMMISNVFLLLTRSLASAHRISQVLEEKVELSSPQNAVEQIADGSVDFDALERLIDFHLQNGTDAILTLGTTGESATMTDDEDNSVVAAVVKQVAGRIPVIAGSGSNSTQTMLTKSLTYQGLGADGLLLITPYYNKSNEEGIYQHFKTVADAVDIPCILYNIPGRCGCGISERNVERLAAHPNIMGIKEASGNVAYAAKIAHLLSDDFRMYSGEDALTVPLMSLGASGTISVWADVQPQLVHDMCRAYLDGDVERARDIQIAGQPLINALFSEVNPIPVKEALAQMGMIEANYRMPLCPMADDTRSALTDALKGAGLLD